MSEEDMYIGTPEDGAPPAVHATEHASPVKKLLQERQAARNTSTLMSREELLQLDRQLQDALGVQNYWNLRSVYKEMGRGDGFGR